MDKNIIEKRLAHISEKLQDLQKDIKLFEDPKNKKLKKTIFGAMQKWAEEIVESAIKINTELLKIKQKFPESYYESFTLLESLNIFSEIDLTKLAGTAGFRNRLAHDYLKLNEEITYLSIKNIVKYYKNYITKIEKYLK